MEQLDNWVRALGGKENNLAYECFQRLVAASRESDAVYQYLGDFADLLHGASGYHRIRGFGLIAENARWDTENQIDQLIGDCLALLTDAKPIVARQAVQMSPLLAKYKPALRPQIRAALQAVDPAKYKDSMRPLVEKDVRQALGQIERL